MDSKERSILLGESKPVIVSQSRFWALRKLGFPDRKYTIEIEPLSYGVVLQVSQELAKMKKSKPKNLTDHAKFFAENEPHITKIIAYALRKKPSSKVPEKFLRFVRENIDVVQSIEIYYFIIEQTNIANFTNAISWTWKQLVAMEKESEAEPKQSD